jgi:hypothetical protein
VPFFCFVFLCTLYYYIIVPLFYFLGLYSFLFNENSLTKSTAVIYGQPTLFIYFGFIFSPFIFLLSPVAAVGFSSMGSTHESTPAESHSTPPPSPPSLPDCDTAQLPATDEMRNEAEVKKPNLYP